MLPSMDYHGLPPLQTSELCCWVYLGKRLLTADKLRGAEGCQASPQHQRCFFQLLPFCGAMQPHGNKPHGLLRKLPSEISCLGLPWGNSKPTKADLLLRSWIHVEMRGRSIHSYGLSLNPANPRACGAFSRFKGCTWRQLLLCSCSNVWTSFSPPISGLESWN